MSAQVHNRNSLKTFEDYKTNARTGMRCPEPITIKAGEIIYRFADSTGSSDLAASPWWLRAEDYTHYKARWEAAKMSEGMKARWALAIQQKWSTLDRLVRAQLLKPLQAYIGTPTTQYREQAPNGMFITYRGDPQIRQLYIPFISSNRFLTPQGRASLSITSWPIESQQLWKKPNTTK